MAVPLSQMEQHKEVHYFGEPWSLNELERIPHLHFLATSVRETLHANKTFRDIEFQNKVAYESFVELCNRDIVFFLKITQQYYLLSQLFGENSPNREKWVHLLDDLRGKYQQQQLQTQSFSTVRPNTVEKPIPTVTFNPPSNFAWSEPDPNWSNFQKWQHYEDELKRITSQYHQQKIQAYSDSLDRDIAHADNVLKKLDTKSPEYREISEIRHNCARRKAELMAQKFDPFISLERLQEQEKEIHQLKRDAHNLFCKAYKSSNNPVLQEAYKRQMKEQEDLDSQMSHLDESFKQAKTELQEKIKECCAASKKEIDNELAQVIDVINNADYSELSPQQKQSLSNLKTQITQYRNELSDAGDPKQYDSIMQQVAETLKSQTSDLPESLKSKIVPIAEQLQKMHVMPDSDLEQETQLNKQADIDVSNPEEDMELEDARVETNLEDASIIDHAPRETSSSIETTRLMKAEMHNIKHNNVIVDVVNVVNPDNKKVETLCTEILKNINSIKEARLSPNEKEILNQIKEKIGELNEVSKEEAVSLISDISANLYELDDKIEDMDSLQARVDTVTEQLESELEEEDSMKVSMR